MCRYLVHTEKSFQNLIKSNRNQIVFTLFRLIWNQTDVHLISINRKMVNTIWFRVDLIRFLKNFSVCIFVSAKIWRVSNMKSIHCTSKLNSKNIPALPSLIFPFHLLPSPVNPTRFSFGFFPGFLVHPEILLDRGIMGA